MLKKMQVFLFGNSYLRVSSILIYLSEIFGKKLPGKETLIDHKFTHQDIAFLAGISREKASITLAKLASEGAIRYQDRRIIIKKDLLTDDYF